MITKIIEEEEMEPAIQNGQSIIKITMVDPGFSAPDGYVISRVLFEEVRAMGMHNFVKGRDGYWYAVRPRTNSC